MSSQQLPAGHCLARSRTDVGESLFVPEHFAFSDQQEMLALIGDYPMAQLFTALDGAHRVTAAPVIVVSGSENSGLRLRGHMAQRNPQVAALAAGCRATAVFSGPGAYISPRWFKVTRTVSTWNYLSVQAHGELQLLGEAQTLAVLEQTIAHMEQRLAHRDPQHSAWSLAETAPELTQRLRGMVSGFELKVDRFEGVKRLNQDKHIVDVLSIMAGLGDSPQPQAPAVLKAMASMLEQAAAARDGCQTERA